MSCDKEDLWHFGERLKKRAEDEGVKIDHCYISQHRSIRTLPEDEMENPESEWEENEVGDYERIHIEVVFDHSED